MISRSVIAAALLLGACSKSDPGTSSTTSALASPASTAAAATGAPGQPPTPSPTTAAGYDHGGPLMPGMSPGMPMQHIHDGGMGHSMPDHPMPGHP